MHGFPLTESADHQIDHMGVHIEVDECIKGLFQSEEQGAHSQDGDVEGQNRGPEADGESFEEYNGEDIQAAPRPLRFQDDSGSGAISIPAKSALKIWSLMGMDK